MSADLTLEAKFIPNPWLPTARAKDSPTNLFSCWSNSVTGLSTNAIHPFRMSADLTLEAKFIPNPWLPNAGTYIGVFFPIADVATTNSGYLTLQLTSAGKVTGKLIQAGQKPRSLSGNVGLDGSSTARVAGSSPLTVHLMFDLTGGSGEVTGSVSNTAWQTALRAVPQVSSPVLVGRHTFFIPGADASTASTKPAGDGVGVLTVVANGSAAIVGNLGEGTPLTFSSGVAKNGDMPVFAAQFGGKGFFIGWLTVSTSSPPLTVIGSSLNWLKPSGLPGQTNYLAGFSETKNLLGARFLPPPRSTNALNWTTNGAVLLDGGQLSFTISNSLAITGRKLSPVDNTNQIALSFDLARNKSANGKLSGSFLHPVTRKTTRLKGVILQMPDGDTGHGWFIGTDESGFLDLRPPSP